MLSRVFHNFTTFDFCDAYRRTHISDGILDDNYEFDIIFWPWRHFEVARRTYDSFLLFFFISRTTCVRIVGSDGHDQPFCAKAITISSKKS